MTIPSYCSIILIRIYNKKADLGIRAVRLRGAMSGYYLLMGLIVLAAISVLAFFIVRSIRWIVQNRNSAQEQEATYLKEIIHRDNQIKKLNVQVNKFVELNSRYLSFMLKVPTIIQRLNSTLKPQNITLSIIELVNDVIVTDTVEIYLLDQSCNLLRKVSVNSQPQQKQASYALGEGLIGAAAEHRFVMAHEHFNKIYSQKQNQKKSLPYFSLAVPIIFKDRLLGVIGVGEISEPSGNEGDVLRMIADIAGVAFRNQFVLDKAQHKANTDPLTGLYNRNYFFEMAEHLLEKSRREGISISIFIMDIDNFKHYNDTLGHDAGDKLLIELSQLMLRSTRKESTIARYGGEEFIVMLPGIKKDDAFVYAERLRENIASHHFQHREKQPLGCVSISGGVATFPDDGDSIYQVIQLADKSLYQAKSEGKNRVFLHQSRSFSGKTNKIVNMDSKSGALS